MRQNSNQTKHLPTLLVQQIRLQWYKDCRSGNAAAQRNQYPRAMRLPKDFFSYYPFGLPTHFASIIQRPDGFQIDRDCRRLMEWKPNGTMRLHPFELIQQEPGIHVRYRNDWHIGAIPERYTYDKTGQKQPLNELALDLAPGEYGKEYGGWPVILRVTFGREPDEHILALLSKCPAWAADYGVKLEFEIGGKQVRIVES